MKCAKCNFENNEDVNFCTSCGEKIVNEVVTNEQEIEKQDVVESEISEEVPRTEETKEKVEEGPRTEETKEKVEEGPRTEETKKQTEEVAIAEESKEPVEEESTVEESKEPAEEESIAEETKEPIEEESTVGETKEPVAIIEEAEMHSVAEDVIDEPVKKKKKKGILVVGVLVIIAIIATFMVYGKELFFKTPEQKLAEATIGMYDIKSGEIYTSVKLTDFNMGTGEDFTTMIIKEILNDINLSSEVRFDKESYQLEGKINLRMQGTSLVKADYYINETYIIVDIPIMYDQPMYIEWLDLFEMIDESKMTELYFDTEEAYSSKEVFESIMNYKALIQTDQYETYEKIDRIPYETILIDYFKGAIETVEANKFGTEFDDSITYKGTEFELEYNFEEEMEMNKELMDIFIDDENIIAFLEEIITVFVDQVIENEDVVMYSLLSETKPAEWDEAYVDELMEFKNDFMDNLEDSVDELEEELVNVEEESGTDMGMLEDMIDIEPTYRIDNKGNMRAVDMDIYIDMSEAIGTEVQLRMEVLGEYNLLNEEIIFEGIDVDSAINIGEMSEEELIQFGQDIEQNTTEKIMGNPMFEGLMSGGF